jgi:hypothetical protein
MNFSRKTILVVGAALLAACGDKVTVQEYTPPVATAKVNSVEVSPSSVTVNTGQSVTFTAAVNADAGLATTVTWSASAGTITTAGVFTAPATGNPGIAVCATSTVDTGKKGCAQVVVTAAPTTIPASVSIASITTNVGGLNAPVNPGAVVGQFDVRLNVNPGNQTISKVVLVVGGVRADSQIFTAAQSAALRYAADEAVAAQATFPQILFSINSAKFSATTGVPVWLNAAQLVSAQLFTSGTTAAASATAQTSLTFANADGFVASVATSGTTANALNASGFRYDRGGLDVTILPVIYSGRTIASATLFFGSAANCDASGTGQRNTALTAPAAGSTAWTKIGWAQTHNPATQAQVNFLTNYEFQTASNVSVTCQTTNPVGETVAVTAVDANGDAILAQAAPLNVSAATSLRLDNRAPGVGSPFFMQNPNGRQNGWINGTVNLVGSSTAMSATSNNWLFNAASVALNGQTARDYGQGSYVRYLRVAAAPTGLVDEARAATASSAPTLPAPSIANNTYCAIATAQDALGNETARPVAGTACTAPVVASNAAANSGANHQLFGVDIAAPTIALVNSADVAGSLNANERRNGATITNTFRVAVSDTGTVGNSGMLSGSSVMGLVLLRNDANAALTAAAKCVVGGLDPNDGVTCNVPASVQAAPAFPYVVTGAAVTGATAAGYYTYTAYSRDAAGNQSGTVTRVISWDLAANVPALTTALYNTPLSGTATFNANASDNFDLRDVTYALTYPTLAGPVVYPAVSLGTFNSTQQYSNISAGITISPFMRQVEQLTGDAPIAVGGGAQKPTTLTGVVRDQANVTNGAGTATAIAGASVTNGTSYLAFVPATQQVFSFSITNAATNISDGAGPLAAVNPLSVTLNIDVFGPTATFNSPFARVDLYALIGGNLVQIGTTSAYSTVDDGSAQGRRHRYQIAWAPGTTAGLGATSLYAIGVSAAGDALVSMVSNNITVTNP